MRDSLSLLALVGVTAGRRSRRAIHRCARALPAGLTIAALVAIGLVALTILFTAG